MIPKIFENPPPVKTSGGVYHGVYNKIQELPKHVKEIIIEITNTDPADNPTEVIRQVVSNSTLLGLLEYYIPEDIQDMNWALAIAMRLSDESDYAEREDIDHIYNVLVTSFLMDPSRAYKSLIGSHVIEEDYFEQL